MAPTGSHTDTQEPHARTEAEGEAARVPVGLRAVVSGGPGRGQRAVIGAAGVRIGSGGDSDLVIEDRRISREHAELRPHPGGVLVRDLGSRNGVYYDGARVTELVAPPGAVISVVQTKITIETDDEGALLPLSNRDELGGLIGTSTEMRRLFTAMERVAPTDYTVLVEGETGTGKEVVARVLHELSPRRGGPLVVFDCAGTTPSLLESELFGHVKGAFTGADNERIGAFRRAHGGTLFIDELSSLSLELQSKLLRALETRRVLPVGADDEHAVDIRVIAASNATLSDEVTAGRFREDLFYRMSVVTLTLPPLRARLGDLPRLTAHFLRTAGFETEVGGTNLRRMMGYAWPGNVRELRNCVERSLALAGPEATCFDDLSIALGSSARTVTWPLDVDLPYKQARERLLAAFERGYANEQLARAGGNITVAARNAGVSRRHFFELLKKHDLLGSGES